MNLVLECLSDTSSLSFGALTLGEMAHLFHSWFLFVEFLFQGWIEMRELVNYEIITSHGFSCGIKVMHLLFDGCSVCVPLH